MTRRLTAAALVAAALLAVASPADADVARVTVRGPAVVTTRTVTATIAADLTPRMTARGPLEDYRASAWIRGTRGWVEVGAVQSTTPRVTFRARLDTAQTGYGVIPIWVTDEYDGLTVRATVTLRRPSRATITRVTASPGLVHLTARVTHYNPARGRWEPSKLSPVRVQLWTPVGWLTQATAATRPDGTVSVLMEAGEGRQPYRVVRLPGASVAAAVSRTVRVTVPDLGPGVGC